MTRKINEIFYSLQGEGANTGVPSVFVRFSGCNLRCPFCDTRHQQGREMTDEEIIAAVARHHAPLTILTGGEPSLWIDSEFVRALKAGTGSRICIETNGTRPLPEGLDWVTVSPKSGICGSDSGDLPIVAQHADEIKVVDLGQPLDPYFQLACRREDTLMYLQSCHVVDAAEAEANLRRTVQRVLDDPRWRLSLQTHRMIDIP